MPLFGGTKRPKLDGLTKDEEKRRDALNPEVLRRAGEKGVAGQWPAAAAILQEKMDEEPRESSVAAAPGPPDDEHAPLRPRHRSLRRGDRTRDDDEIRAHYGAGHAYFQAAEAQADHGRCRDG